MVLRVPRHELPVDNANSDWLTLAEARDLLGAASEDVLRYWVRLGLLRSSALPDGEPRVSREDVLHQKCWQDINAAFPGEEMTEEELAARRQAGQELLPWRVAAWVNQSSNVGGWSPGIRELLSGALLP